MYLLTTGAVDPDPLRQSASIVAGTYREMPGLSLCLPQAARLFGLGAPACQLVLDDLVQQGYLHRGSGGRYIRS